MPEKTKKTSKPGNSIGRCPGLAPVFCISRKTRNNLQPRPRRRVKRPKTITHPPGKPQCGNAPLTAQQVLDLRVLTGKAKALYAAYLEKVTGVKPGQEDPEKPAKEPKGRDKTRLDILNGLDEMLDGDLTALQNHDVSKNPEKNLDAVLQEKRGLTADVRGKQVASVGQGVSARMVLEADGTKGVFTEDYKIETVEKTLQNISSDYPMVRDLFGYFKEKSNVLVMLDVMNFKDAKELEDKINNRNTGKKDIYVNDLLETLEDQVPHLVDFRSKEFIRQFSEAVFRYSAVKSARIGASSAHIGEGKNIPRRNAAMTMVADRLGLSGLTAHSKFMTVQTDKGPKKGVFMEWAEGLDVAQKVSDRKDLPELNGKKVSFTSPDVIKSASDLQALDYICGNTDRHHGNVMYQFEERNGVMTLVGIQGFDNDTSFGNLTAEKGENYLAGPDSMRVMKKSTAESILRMTKEELSYSLYGLVEADEIDMAWKRTQILQDKIKKSMGMGWKDDASLRTDGIHILDDNSPACTAM